MSFISIEFAIFLFLVLVLNWLLRPARGLYRLFLLGACYTFYGLLNLKFLALLIHFSLWTWLLGRGIAFCSTRWIRQSFLIFHLLIGIGGLILFKYYDLLYESLDHLAAHIGTASFLPQTEIAVPAGISFFTLQGLSYSIDVFRDANRQVKNPTDVLIFVAFFPTILSGPIMRASDFVPQIGNMGHDRKSSSEAFCLILSGLAKKLVLASYLSKHVVQPVFEDCTAYSSPYVALGIVACSIQIFCDFSGYTDLVRGIALLMGYSIPENFNNPYSAKNLREFWNRWHMSLSFWLRDYLYFPLGGNRRGTIRKYLNILITMLLGGLWHGSSWNFLLWGGFHGIGICVTHLFKSAMTKIDLQRNPGSRIWHQLLDVFAWFSTFAFVSIGWVFFFCRSIADSTAMLSRLTVFDTTTKNFSYFSGPVTLFIIITVLIHESFRVKLMAKTTEMLYDLPIVYEVLIFGFLLTLLIRFAPDGVPEFIYYQF